jgi:splicing factor U2AF subunit
MGLNNLKIGDKTLTVRRAQPKSEVQPGMGIGMGGAAFGQGFGGMDPGMAGLNPAQLGALAALRAQGGLGGLVPQQMAPTSSMPPARSQPTRILVLLQMVVADILRDDQEYKEIYEDIETECRRYGEVRSVIIPRPHPAGAPVNGLGKVFVEFGAVDQAMKARAEVEGRQFDGRTVIADFWNEDKYARRELD